jgi:hypothetical protein
MKNLSYKIKQLILAFKIYNLFNFIFYNLIEFSVSWRIISVFESYWNSISHDSNLMNHLIITLTFVIYFCFEVYLNSK